MPPTVRTDCTATPHDSASAMAPNSSIPTDKILSIIRYRSLSDCGSERPEDMIRENTFLFHPYRNHTKLTTVVPARNCDRYCNPSDLGATKPPLEESNNIPEHC